MNLKIINEIIGNYSQIVIEGRATGHEVLGAEIDKFQAKWDSEVSDFKAMFTDCFTMDFGLWQDKDFYPLQSILRYTDINPEVVRSIFKDLFHERREIVGRIDRFLYQCDDFVLVDRRNDLKAPPHYHQDKSIIFAYLCFMYPDVYAIYHEQDFLRFMTKVGAKDLDELPDINRYLKVCKVVKTLMLKHPTFAKAMESITESEDQPLNLMVHVGEIMRIT